MGVPAKQFLPKFSKFCIAFIVAVQCGVDMFVFITILYGESGAANSSSSSSQQGEGTAGSGRYI